jgi:hypothetical protein
MKRDTTAAKSADVRNAGRTEERFIPEVRPVMERLRFLREAFVRAALAHVSVGQTTLGVVNAVMDYWAWRTLRREVGFTQEQAVAAAVEAVRRIAAAGGP